MSDDEKNGGGTVHQIRGEDPTGRGLTEKVIHKQAALDREMTTLEKQVDDLWHARTPWHRATDSKLRTMADRLLAIQAASFAWPTLLALATLFLGGFAAVLVWLIAHH